MTYKLGEVETGDFADQPKLDLEAWLAVFNCVFYSHNGNRCVQIDVRMWH